MYKVIKRPKTPNIIWDTAGSRPLCRFVNGVFETADDELARRLQALGYTVDPEPPDKEPGKEPEKSGKANGKGK